MTVTFNQRIGRRVDITVVDIVAQLVRDGVILHPERVDKIRSTVMVAFHEAVRLAEEQLLEKAKTARFTVIKRAPAKP